MSNINGSEIAPDAEQQAGPSGENRDGGASTSQDTTSDLSQNADRSTTTITVRELKKKLHQRKRAHYGLEELETVVNSLAVLQSRPSELNRKVGRVSEILLKLKDDLANLNSEIDDLIEELGPTK